MSTPAQLARTPEPPYYAVMFTSQRTAGDRGYGDMAERMAKLAAKQPGYLGVDGVRNADGLGITVSYWRDEASILAWKRDTEHQQAQKGGQQTWYADYQVRIAKVERAYGKPQGASSNRRFASDRPLAPDVHPLQSPDTVILNEVKDPRGTDVVSTSVDPSQGSG